MQATIRKLALATGLVVLGSIAAPAFAADPPMVGGAPMEPTRTIVDNASASKGHTTLVMALRLWTIEKADMILVMDQGKLVERGTHTQLLQANGYYARLHAMGLDEPEKVDIT